jgi:iron complex transport system ATP-binding protein
MGRYPYLSPFSSTDKEGRRAAEEALRVTGTAEFAGRRLDTLSGGERQKVYIAAALAQGSDILLLDEPTTFLDYRHQAEIRDLLSRVNRQSSVTIVCVTHDLNRAVLDSDRIVALAGGRVLFAGRPDEIMQSDVLETLFHTPFVLTSHPETAMPMIVPGLPPRCPP